MITAVDTNVLLDVFGADPEFGQRSAEVNTIIFWKDCAIELDARSGVKIPGEALADGDQRVLSTLDLFLTCFVGCRC